MRKTIRPAIGLALTMLGTWVLLPAKQAGAQETTATKPVQESHAVVGVQGPFDDSTARAVAIYSALVDQPEKIDPREQLFRIHGVTAACTSCHGAAAKNERTLDAVVSSLDFLFTHADGSDANLGLTLQPVEEAVKAQLGLEANRGLLVVSLADHGPAMQAGLLRNDILLTLGEAALGRPGDLSKTLKAVGEKEVPLAILRAGKPMTLKVQPVARMTLGPAAPEKKEYYIGVSASPPDEVLRAHVQLPEGQGLLVTEVVPQSPAEKAGIKKYDILLEMGDKPLDKTETLSARVQAIGNQQTTLKYRRGTASGKVTVKPEPRNVDFAAQIQGEPVKLWTTAANPYVHSYTNQLQPWLLNWNQRGIQTYSAPTATVSDPETTAKRLDQLEKKLETIRELLEKRK